MNMTGRYKGQVLSSSFFRC